MPREATQFKPGQSGNPGGRPKRKPITDALIKELTRKAPGSQTRHDELVAWKLVQLAIAGNVQAAKEVIDRVEGKAVESHELSGPDGGAIRFTIRLGALSGDRDPPADG